MNSLAIGQIVDPVKWKFKAIKVDANIYEIHYTATMESPWHIYSQSSSKMGSSPTVISINKHKQIKPFGAIQETGKLISKYVEILDVTLKYYQESVDFVQKVKIKGNLPVTVQGNIEYSACKDEQCLPSASIDFSILLEQSISASRTLLSCWLL